MLLEIPDDLPTERVRKGLAAMGCAIDGRTGRNGVARVIDLDPGTCCEPGCQHQPAIRYAGALYCSTHALAHVRAGGSL